MSDFQGGDASNIIDRSVKALFRECPAAVMRLAGMVVEQANIRVEDPNLNLPELRADHVFIIEEEQASAFAIYVEYQLEPDVGLLTSWAAKWGGLSRQLGMPVILLAIYLQRGDRATFHDRYTVQAGGLTMNLTFPIIRLWEHAERIRSGELLELAPLLVLCEEVPTTETVREEVALIRGSVMARDTQRELLGLALLVASRRFRREVLYPLFRENWDMIEGLEILDDLYRDTGKIDQWISEGEAKGKAEGKLEGEILGVRETLLAVGRKRFGEPGAEVLQALTGITSAETLQHMAVRLLEVESWEELLPSA